MLYGGVYKDDYLLEYHIVRMYETEDGAEQIIMRVEKNNDCRAFAEFRLPAKNCYKAFGFSEDELGEMERYLLYNEPLIWDDAREAFSCWGRCPQTPARDAAP